MSSAASDLQGSMHSLDDCAEHVKNDRPLYERLFKTFNRLGDLAKAYGATVFGGDYQQAVGALAPFRHKVGLPDASDGTCSQCYYAAHWPAHHNPFASATYFKNR